MCLILVKEFDLWLSPLLQKNLLNLMSNFAGLTMAFAPPLASLCCLILNKIGECGK